MEVIIGLPLFLMGLFLMFWLGLLMNDDSSLRSAVTTAVDLAATRGDSVLMGYSPRAAASHGIIGAVQRYLQGASFSEVKPLLTSDNLPEGYDAEEMYSRWISRNYPGATLRDMRPETLYALIYTYEALKQSSGGRLRFPCTPYYRDDAVGQGVLEEPHGPGCVKCEPLDRDALALANCPGRQCPQNLLGAHGVPQDRFGIRCVYRSDSGLLGTLVALVGMNRQSDIGLLRVESWRFLRYKDLY